MTILRRIESSVARGEPDAQARAALQRAAVALDAREGRPRPSDRALMQQAWRGLVSGQWRLVDHFDSHGKKYVVITVSDEAPASRPASMSEREHEVMQCAALGRTNKEIAADLGLAQSTVRVLLHRAALKLGTTGRVEAIDRFRALCEPDHLDEAESA